MVGVSLTIREKIYKPQDFHYRTHITSTQIIGLPNSKATPFKAQKLLTFPEPKVPKLLKE